MVRVGRSHAIVFVALLLGASGWVYQRATRTRVRVGDPMPVAMIRDASGVHPLSVPDGRSSLVLIYHSDCLHCQYELSQLDADAADLGTTSLALLTTEDSTKLQAFRARWPHLLNAPAVQLAHIDPRVVGEAFGVDATPTLLLFDANRRLAASYVGEVSFSVLRPRIVALAAAPAGISFPTQHP